MFIKYKKDLTFCQIIEMKNNLFKYKSRKVSTISVNTTHTKSSDNSKTKTKIENNLKTIYKNDSKVEKDLRFNRLGIQMISKSLWQTIFGESVDQNHREFERQNINEMIKGLRSHGLNARKDKPNQRLNDLNVEKYLPKLLSNDLSKHFQLLGQRFGETYKKLTFELIDTPLPQLPEHWVLREGWTRYSVNSNGQPVVEKVDYPLENNLVFDVEVCMNDSDGQKPTLATAASPKAWYSWCSRRLIECTDESVNRLNSKTTLNDLIPMGCALNEDKLIIGHNVSFDRSFIREQYDINTDRTRFLDTLSLHMCVSGLTQHQRALSYSKKIKDSDESSNDINKSVLSDESVDPLVWSGVGSLNNLVDVYHLYCDDQEVSKDPRNVFIKGSIKDVFNSFDDLMTYCANDVLITHKILKTIFPLFLDRFPHSVTFVGMLEMSVMYLPVVPHNWNRYVSECDSIYNDQERELNLSLRELANDACALASDQQYTKDVWLWDLDWETQEVRFKKPVVSKSKKTKTNVSNMALFEAMKSTGMSESVARIMSTASTLKKVQPLLAGYPKWYLEFCSKLKYDFNPESEVTTEDMEWESGPYRISTQMRSVPKLMRLLWDGYPIHFDEKYGWGYLMPDVTADDCPDRVPGGIDRHKNTIYFPLKEFKEIIKRREEVIKGLDFTHELESIETLIEENDKQMKGQTNRGFDDIIKGCLFYKLPHKGGPDKRVGNPLSKDFLKKVSEGLLTSMDSQITDSVLNLSKRLSYWKNASKRIRSQIVIGCDNGMSGAILPRVIVAGTVTRRAVEPTWLTASNAVADRIGSELKSMIQCPEGYHYVGADVDSQELWIASLIGDSHHSGIHGSTGIGWMTLRGNRADGTDMHSKTAASIHISRDEAKVLNYARIYGSGQPFAARFLMQSNPSLTQKDAKEKAKKIFIETKGNRKKIFKKVSKNEESVSEDTNAGQSRRQWTGGTESQMFNKLEEIAESSEPRTPVLECRISRALEPCIVKDSYITSRINWVVQSSAVDFLHLMLVSMKWLFNEMQIKGRFSISIHDELRYLVRSEDKYKAALALQLSNLLTRSLFAYKLGLNDLPLSVAFFSRVDIDKCLRKEVDIDSKTPSNPLGLTKGYGIPIGQSLDITDLMNKINETNRE